MTEGNLSVSNSEANTHDNLEQLTDLRAVLRGSRRQSSLLAAVASTAFLGVLLFTLLSEEQYTAETSLIIETKPEVFAYGKEIVTQVPVDPLSVETEVEILRSRAMARRVAMRLGVHLEDTAPDAAAETSAVETGAEVDALQVIEDFAALKAEAALPEAGGQPAPGAVAEEAAHRGDDAAVQGGGDELALDETPILAAGLLESPIEEAGSNRPLASAMALTPEPSVPSAAVNRLLSNLQVERVGLTSLIKIRYTSPSPVYSQQVANAYAEEYISAQIESDVGALNQANEWIDGRLEELREEVRVAERDLAVYRARENLVAPLEGSSFIEQRIEALAAELTKAQSNLAAVKTRYNMILRMRRQNLPIDAIGEVMTSGLMTDLSVQQTALKTKIAELRVRYGDRHPEIRTAKEELAALDAQIEAQIRRIESSVRAEYELAAAQVTMVKSELADVQSKLAEESNVVAGLEELQRNVEATKGIYEALLNRKNELNERDSLAKADARIVARASTPDVPSKPRRKLILAGGVVFAVLLGGAAAFVSEMVDTRIKNTSSLRREFGQSTPVVLVPRIRARRLFRESNTLEVARKHLLDAPHSNFATAMRDLRIQLRAAEEPEDGEAVTIAFASVFEETGSTTTAFAFAALLASTGKRVAIVDSAGGHSSLADEAAEDGQRPLLAEPFGQLDDQSRGERSRAGARWFGGKRDDPDSSGATENEASAAPGSEAGEFGEAPDDALIPIGGERAVAVAQQAYGVAILQPPNGPNDGRRNPGHREIDLGGIAGFVEANRPNYDYIILDTPALMNNIESTAVAATADFVFVLTEWCVTTREAARVAAERLVNAQARILGFVVTKVDEKQRAYFNPEDRHFYFKRPR